MRIREFEMCLQGLTPRTPSDLDIRFRKLREDGKLRQSGRRLDAPPIERGEAANILIACAGSRSAVDAADAVSTFRRLVPWGDGFAGADTFGEAFEAVLSKPELADAISEIALTLPVESGGRHLQPWPFATIRWRQGGAEMRATYIPKKQLERVGGADPGNLGSATMRDVVVFGRGFLHDIASRLNDADDDDEWDTAAGYASEDEIRARGAAVRAAEAVAEKEKV